MQMKHVQIDFLEEKAREIRRDLITMIYKAKDGHPAPSLSAADIITALYFGVMNIRPSEPLWSERDRFILSKGHACPALYAALARRGYFSTDHFSTLRKFGSILQGHPDMNKTPGIDMNAGSLGNGLSIGFGMAMAAKIKNSSYRTYVLCGDGELGEGIIWEAALSVAKYKLSNLTLIVDYNGFQSGGLASDVGGLVKLAEKWEAFGFNVIQIDGNDMNAVMQAFNEALKYTEGPSAIIAHTIKGKGVPYMENDNAWHKGFITDEYFKKAMIALGGDCDA